MSRSSPRIFGAMVGLWLVDLRLNAAELRLPPITGELEGTLTQYALPGAPALHWKFVAKPANDGMRDGVVTIDGQGTQLRASVHVSGNGDGTWRIEESHVDAAPWLATIAPQFAPSLVGLVVEGNVSVTGEGNLRQGRLDGKMKIELSGGAVRNADQGWSLGGVAFKGEFTFDSEGSRWASVSPLELTVGTVATTRFGARNVFIRGLLDQRLVLTGQEARVELAGGDVTLEPFTLPLNPLAIDLKIHLKRIGLQDVIALVPTGLAEARGRVDGEIQIGWSKAGGFNLGAGSLALRDDEPTIVRFAPAVGLLSGSMPERFVFLPAWLGPVSRWFSPLNPAHADLRAIELGQTELKAESLQVKLTPEGDARGRSAHVEMTARPLRSGTSVDRVTFDIDVSGPLSELLKLSTDERTGGFQISR